MTIANMTSIAHFVKAKEIENKGNNGKTYKRVLLFLTYHKSAPQFIVETSPNKFEEIQKQGLKTGDFLFVTGELTLLKVSDHEYEEYISAPQKLVCKTIPVIKNSTVVLQPSGCVPTSSVTYVGQLMHEPSGERNDKPFFRYSNNGLAILNISPVVRGGYKDAPSSWMDTVFFSNKAEFVVNHFKKKDLIAVDGILDLSSWESKILDEDTMEEKDVTKYSWSIRCNNVRFCSLPKYDGGAEVTKETTVPAVATKAKEDDWDGIPF